MLEVIDGPSSQATTPHNTQHVVSCDLFSLGALSLFVCSLYCCTIQLSQSRSLFTSFYFTFLSFVFAQLAIVSHIFVTLRPHINPFVSFISCEDEVNRLEHDCIIYQHRVIIKAFDAAGW